jgi:hypothetical protein
MGHLCPGLFFCFNTLYGFVDSFFSCQLDNFSKGIEVGPLRVFKVGAKDLSFNLDLSRVFWGESFNFDLFWKGG